MLPDNFVLDAMNKAYDPELNMVQDVRYDMSDLPTAANFYDYCANVVGKKIKLPFARQMWILLWAFGDVCPACTHPNAKDMTRVPVDADPHALARKMTLLHFGKCPKCGLTRNRLIQDGILNDYIELILPIGQRAGKCVTGDTLVPTSDGLLTFAEIAASQSTAEGFSTYTGPHFTLERGRKVQPSRFYRERKMPLRKVTLANGQSITGTDNHPLWTLGGWMPLKELTPGMLIPVRIGQNTWAQHPVLLKPYAQAAVKLHLSRVQKKDRTKSPIYPVRSGYVDEKLAAVLGYWVSEGSTENARALSISNTDQNILNLCVDEFERTFRGSPMSRSGFKHARIGLTGSFKAALFDGLLDGALTRSVKSADKEIPLCIRKSPRRVVVAFLRALFEGDGCVNSGQVDYNTISPTLARQLQVLLLNLGVYCRLKEGVAWATNGTDKQVAKPSYVIRIQGHEWLRRFEERVGFVSDRKRGELAAVLAKRDSKTKNMPDATDKLPPHIRQQWSSVMRKIQTYLHTLRRPGSDGMMRRIGIRVFFGDQRIGLGRSDLCATRGVVQSSCSTILNHELRDMVPADYLEELERIQQVAENLDTLWIEVASNEKAPADYTYDVEVPDYHRFMANGLLNHNSTMTATACSYITHRYLKAPKLASVANGIQEFTPLTGSFVALTVNNAVKLLWHPFRSIILESSWFEDYFSKLKEYGQESGKELFQFNPTGNYFRVFTKNLAIAPEGPGKRTLRGPTRFFSAIDELGHFPYDPNASPDDEDDDERERANADEVYTVLGNSLSTVQGEVYNLYRKNVYAFPQAMNFLVSSPASWFDKIMRLYTDATTNESTTQFAVKAATWEINPGMERNHPTIVKAYNANPRKAERDFGANPPKLDSSVFTREQVRPLFHLDNAFGITYDNTNEFTRGKVVLIRKPATWPACVLALDAGLKNNAFAMSLLHRTSGGVVKVLGLIEIVAMSNLRRIDFKYTWENVIRPIIKACNVKMVYADRWNSEFILRLCEEECKIVAKTYSLKPADFSAFIEFVATGNLQLPRMEMEFDQAEGVIEFKTDFLKAPVAHLYTQFLSVQELAGVLVKGQGRTDDLMRSLILGATRLFDPKVSEHMAQFRSVERAIGDPRSLIITAGRSGRMLHGQQLRNALLYGTEPVKLWPSKPDEELPTLPTE